MLSDDAIAAVLTPTVQQGIPYPGEWRAAPYAGGDRAIVAVDEASRGSVWTGPPARWLAKTTRHPPPS